MKFLMGITFVSLSFASFSAHACKLSNSGRDASGVKEIMTYILKNDTNSSSPAITEIKKVQVESWEKNIWDVHFANGGVVNYETTIDTSCKVTVSVLF